MSVQLPTFSFVSVEKLKKKFQPIRLLEFGERWCESCMRHFMVFNCTVYSDSLQALIRLPAYSAAFCHSQSQTQRKGWCVGWEVEGSKTSRGKNGDSFLWNIRFVQKIHKKRKIIIRKLINQRGCMPRKNIGDSRSLSWNCKQGQAAQMRALAA